MLEGLFFKASPSLPLREHGLAEFVCELVLFTATSAIKRGLETHDLKFDQLARKCLCSAASKVRVDCIRTPVVLIPYVIFGLTVPQ